ncbi:MAG: polysaccharide biosynthesis/export family protein, partial [Phycisphaerae bacterium]|nr:polysaccharide biosynthesis/export family protein [Phycisphaerae bacterium]
MNLGIKDIRRYSYAAFFVLSVCFLGGCGDNVTLPSSQQLAVFQNAGPIAPQLDLDILVNSKSSSGLYRITRGDMLEIQMPQVLQAVTAEYNTSPINSMGHFCRVFENGKITLPIIGEIPAEGMTVSELEQSIIKAYYPRYCINRPSVVGYIREYRTAKVSITGAVANPGVYELRSDQMSLVSLIMEAGGIKEDGAAVIHVDHHDNLPEELKVDQPVEELLVKIPEIKPEPAQPKIEFDPDGEITDPNLNFKYRQHPNSRSGTIIASRYDKDIYIKTIDVTDPLQRIRFAMDLVLVDKSISSVEALRHICRLAEAVKPGSGSQDVALYDDQLKSQLAELIEMDNAAKTNSDALKIADGDDGLTRELLDIPNVDSKPSTTKSPEVVKLEAVKPEPPQKPGPLVLPVKG